MEQTVGMIRVADELIASFVMVLVLVLGTELVMVLVLIMASAWKAEQRTQPLSGIAMVCYMCYIVPCCATPVYFEVSCIVLRC